MAFAVLLTCSTTQSAASEPTWLSQVLAPKDAKTWYSLSQGSRLIRKSWVEALSAKDGSGKFFDRTHFSKFGFPYADDDEDMPIGFVYDRSDAEHYLGLNCAACHTSNLTYQGTELLIHGGQNFSDLRQMIEELVEAVQATLSDEATFTAFQTAVGQNDSNLRQEVEQWLAERHAIDRTLEGTQDWLPGSADAVSYIFGATTKGVSEDLNFEVHPGNAPVNFPPAWNANQQERLQHSGLVWNGWNYSLFGTARDGALVRNVSEAYGVFAELDVDKEGKVTSSVDMANLVKIENALTRLQSPQWPQDIFGPLDKDKITQGRNLFKTKCSSCHGSIDPTDIETVMPLKKSLADDMGDAFVYVQPVVDQTVTSEAQEFGLPANPMLIGTDPMMVCNFLMHRSSSGNFNGLVKKNTLESMAFFDRFGPEEMTTDIMAGILMRDISQNLPNLFTSQIENETAEVGRILSGWFNPNPLEGVFSLYSLSDADDMTPLDQVRAKCADFAVKMNRIDPELFPMPGYKTRPLNGIWATPPFLHNGSVPTLWHLLQKPEDRPVSFYVGSKEFDPKQLGLAHIDTPIGQQFNVYDSEGNVILGNWNGGHDYGTDLSDAEKWAIIEYAKSQ